MSWLLRTSSLVPRLAGSVSRRLYSGTGEKTLTEGEKAIRKVLDERFKQATFINVEDISGGCGSMYEIQIESPEFKGKRTVMQHRMVNEALKEQIKDMHGLRISTAVPEGT